MGLESGERGIDVDEGSDGAGRGGGWRKWEKGLVVEGSHHYIVMATKITSMRMLHSL